MFHDRTIRVEQLEKFLRFCVPLYYPLEQKVFRASTVIFQIPTGTIPPPITKEEFRILARDVAFNTCPVYQIEVPQLK